VPVHMVLDYADEASARQCDPGRADWGFYAASWDVNPRGTDHVAPGTTGGASLPPMILRELSAAPKPEPGRWHAMAPDQLPVTRAHELTRLARRFAETL